MLNHSYISDEFSSQIHQFAKDSIRVRDDILRHVYIHKSSRRGARMDAVESFLGTYGVNIIEVSLSLACK